MAKKKEIKNIDELLQEALIPKEEQPYEIPSNWEWVRTGNTLEELKNGTTQTQNKDGIGVKVTRIESIQKDEIDFNRIGFIENINALSDNDYYLEGDIAFSHINSYEHVGKTALIKKEYLPLIHGMNLLRFRFKDFYVSEYIAYLMKSIYYRNTIRDKIKRAVNQVSINQKVINEIPLPLPPLSEQTRIVNKLEFMLSKLKEAKEKIAEAKESFELRRASILHKAFTGELTAQWREEKAVNSEELTVNSLLEKINEEKIKNWEEECRKAELEGKKKPSKPKLKMVEEMKISDDEKPYDLPQGWEWVRSESAFLTSPRNGKSVLPSSNTNGIKNLKLGSITRGQFDGTEYKYVDLDIDKESYLWLKKNDFLIQRANSIDYVGVSAIYDDEDYKYIYPDLIMKVRISKLWNVRLFHLFFNNQKSREYFQKNATGTAGNMPKINQEIVNNLPIIFIPQPEQQEIVARIEALLKAEEDAKDLLNMEEQIDLLEKSILSKAFRGELGTNDPSDEPALELLKRVLGE